jgi:hypothetical protein
LNLPGNKSFFKGILFTAEDAEIAEYQILKISKNNKFLTRPSRNQTGHGAIWGNPPQIPPFPPLKKGGRGGIYAKGGQGGFPKFGANLRTTSFYALIQDYFLYFLF